MYVVVGAVNVSLQSEDDRVCVLAISAPIRGHIVSIGTYTVMLHMFFLLS